MAAVTAPTVELAEGVTPKRGRHRSRSDGARVVAAYVPHDPGRGDGTDGPDGGAAGPWLTRTWLRPAFFAA